VNGGEDLPHQDQRQACPYDSPVKKPLSQLGFFI
jgi:hypothetical protein